MSTAPVLEAVAVPASAIGRYFSVLSVVPSALFTAYAFALLASGASGGGPDWQRSAAAFAGLGLAGLAALSLASVLVGLLLHPLQYSLVQVCEGYWGSGDAPVRAMRRRVIRHQRLFDQLQRRRGAAAHALDAAGQSPGDPDAPPVGEDNIGHLTVLGETGRALGRYPRDRNDIRPTRLGNVLRRHEADAGAAYALPGVTVVPHLALVAPPADVAYLDDQRTQMDLSVRLAVLSALATALTVAVMWRAGLWVLLALAPYAAAYVFYRGAVGQAQGYGTAIMVLVDLNRFALYERLRVPLPVDLAQERRTNVQLGRLLRDLEPVSLKVAGGPRAADDPPAPAVGLAPADPPAGL